jgi:hypothetical protein
MILPHPKSRVKMTMPRRRLRPKLVLVLACAPATSAGADAALRAPVLMTLDGVSGARPGMSVDAVSKYWGMRLRPSYEVSPTCGQAFRAYPVLGSRPDRYIHGGRQYFLRRKRLPHWQLRFDVSPRKRVTQIVFGEGVSVRLDEGCA